MTQPDRVIATISLHHGDHSTAHTAGGPPDTIAAWLRAWANRLDPAQARDNGPPGPATGLRTDRRDTKDHHDPNYRSNLGFAPVKAGLEMGDAQP